MCMSVPAGSSNALKLLVDDLLEQLAAATSPHKQQQPQGSSLASAAAGAGSAGVRRLAGVTPAAGEWQCQAAAAVVVLTEVLFGASAAWHAPIGSSSSSTPSSQQQQQAAAADSGYESVLLQVMSAVTQPRLWGLPTSQPGPDSAAYADEQGGRQQLPAQVSYQASVMSVLNCFSDV
jgi:hypothetical protein